MKSPIPVQLLLLSCLAFAGCGHMEVDTAGPVQDSNRVVRGTVEIGNDLPLPADAVVAVRVMDQVHQNYRNPTAVLGEASATTPLSLPPDIVGEQRITHPAGGSVPFEVKFYATDQQLASGLVLQARVSFGGRVRYFNVESYAVNTRNLEDPRHIYVNQVR